jgi:hypothetical protein
MRAIILLFTVITSFGNARAEEIMSIMTAKNDKRAEAVESSTPPMGKYACFFISYSQFTGLRIYPTGMGFIILNNTKYSLPSKLEDTGEYIYDINSKELIWVSGPLAAMKPDYTYKYSGLNSTGYTVTMYNKDGSIEQNCYMSSKTPGR